jgi:hypothetical protein
MLICRRLLADLAGRSVSASGAPYTVLVAAPGADKSVVFAQLARTLAAHSELLVLVHAAGITPTPAVDSHGFEQRPMGTDHT